MDKIPELLSKLLENSSLTTLFLGIFLIIFSGVENIPVGSAFLIVSSQVKTILLALGIILTSVSTLSLFKDKIFKPSKGKRSENNIKNQKELEEKQDSIVKLEVLVQEIRTFVESRNDEVSLAVIDILNGVRDQAREFEKAARESRLAAQWLSSKKQTILQSAKFSDLNSQTLEKFRAEIQRYIELVIESLEKAKYIAPRARDITFHVGNPFPYVQAIESLKSQIEFESNRHPDGLKETELERLNGCIDNLIEVVRRESSRQRG
jgi:regulator of PEP synthase PpsR (kinase-PPPase family)